MSSTAEAVTAPQTVEDYLELPYHITLVRDHWDDGREGWVAEVDELRGCMTQGETPDEAVARIHEAMHSWIEAGLADGHEIPLPRAEHSYSGRFLLRIPKSLHAELAQRADEEGVSLNQYVGSLLARGVGR